jgi:glycosyltransferase involved in cell wall biosynthesis
VPPLILSVVVPVRDDPRVARCLEALARQDADPSAYEVLVVDNGSKAPVAVPEAARAVRLLAEPRRGGFRARNRGAREAAGTIVAFVDADCVPPTGWVSHLLDLFRGGDCDVATGPSGTLGDEPVSHLVQRLEERRWRTLAGEGTVTYCDTRNLAVRRDLLLREPFDESLSSAADIEWGLRIARAGARIRFVPGLAVGHAHVTTLDAVRRRGIRRGQGMAGVYQRHGPEARISAARPLALLGRDVKGTVIRILSRPLMRRIARPALAVATRGLVIVLGGLLRVAPQGDWDRPFEILDRLSLLEGYVTPRP